MKSFLTSVVLGATSLLIGCTSSGTSAPITAANIGSYSAVPANQNRPRVGITAFKVEADAATMAANTNLAEYAADQMAQLLEKSGRFNVIERADFSSLLERQNHADIVRPGALVHPAELHDVDYILVGTISNLSISKKSEDPGVMDKITDFVKQSPKNKQVVVTATCGVGFSIVDPSTNDIVIANNSELNRTAGATELGIDILPGTAEGEAKDLPVSPADREAIIRLALDDAIRKSLPKIDRFLESRAAPMTPSPAPVESTPTKSAPAAPMSAAPAPTTQSDGAQPATVICPNCGAQNDAAAKFCKRCGAKLK